jgi:DNA polymerase-3 subunit alpha
MEKLAKEKEVVGIYISGHPLDDYKFEMKYFCNSKLENLKNLKNYIGKNLTFAGIVSNVQYRTGKTGKDWASFTLEGYDENFDFRIFNEEYLKFRHFLVNNQFIFFKVLIKEGWINKETGNKSEPQIAFQDAKLLADVLPQFAKKLSIQIDIKELQQNFMQQLNEIFNANKGDNPVTFEVVEQENVKKELEIIPKTLVDDEDNLDVGEEEAEEIEIPIVEEENRVITRVSMPSRKLKIKISKELLLELEKMNIKISLN